MNEIPQFEVICRYREGNMYCSGGFVYAFEPGNEMAMLGEVEGEPMKCPRCGGIGRILTPAGKQLVEMVWRHLEARVAELIGSKSLE